jgi:acetyltransferase-like isoleucine patch superfamily enzyme
VYRFGRDIVFCYVKLGTWHRTWRFHSLPLIQKHRSSSIKIGQNFVACSNARNNSIGVFQKVTLKTCRIGSEIVLGNNVGLSGAVISSMGSIKIGNNVLIGSGVLITDNDAHPINPILRKQNNRISVLPIEIKDNVFIGARSIILKGVIIGEGALIGAGAVVTKSIPDFAIVAGNPARIIGDVRNR